MENEKQDLFENVERLLVYDNSNAIDDDKTLEKLKEIDLNAEIKPRRIDGVQRKFILINGSIYGVMVKLKKENIINVYSMVVDYYQTLL